MQGRNLALMRRLAVNKRRLTPRQQQVALNLHVMIERFLCDKQEALILPLKNHWYGKIC